MEFLYDLENFSKPISKILYKWSKFKIIQEAMCRRFWRSNGENGDASEKYIYFKLVFKGYVIVHSNVQ